MTSQSKLIKTGIRYTDKLFQEISNRLSRGIKQSDTLESFINQTKDYTISNPLVTTGYKDAMISIILQETNNHKFSRPAQKDLARITIENYVGDQIVDVGEDIKANVRDIVKEGYDNNLSQDEIAKDISHGISVIKNKRARAIARTEIARTATVSDYIINKERGATHFTVDCRNTACDVCKKKVLTNPPIEIPANRGISGDVEFSIDETHNLPPYHPNCRCVAMFFKKGTMGEFHDDADTFEVLPYVQLSEDKIPDIFSEKVKKGFLEFDKKIKDAEWEYVYISNLTTDEIGGIYTNKKPNTVTPRTEIKIGNEDELLVTHNHRSHMPFNGDDFESIFENPLVYVKYIVVHTPTDIFICELDHAALPNQDIIIKEIAKCYGPPIIERGIEDKITADKIWDNYKSNEVLNKYMSFKRIKK